MRIKLATQEQIQNLDSKIKESEKKLEEEIATKISESVGLPLATANILGAVRVNGVDGEEAPFTVPSVRSIEGRLDSDNIGLGVKATAGTYGIAIGRGASAGNYGVSLGRYTSTRPYGIAIGRNTSAGNNSTALGYEASAESFGIAIGGDASANEQGTALGYGSIAQGRNSVALGYNAVSTDAYTGVLGSDTSLSTNKWIVPGDFSVRGTKNFEIPHPNPKKTETHVLRHGAVETNSQGDNLYRYKIEAKEDGDIITINLPDYFVHLNKNIQVWATGANHFGNAFGTYKPDEEVIEITCEKTGEYNVLVVGTRNDNHKSIQSWSDKGVERLKTEAWTFAEDEARLLAEEEEETSEEEY